MSEENEEGAEKCVPASKLKREHLELYDLAQGPTVPKSPTSPDESTQRKIVEIIRKKGQVKKSKRLTLDEIVRLFSDPDMLKKTLDAWSRAEPKSMREALAQIPNPTAKEIIDQL